VDSRCNDIQEALVELAGEREQLAAELLAHLDQCEECRAVSDSERRLSEMLRSCVPEANLETAVQAAVSRSRVWRRVKNALPVLAAVIVLLSGIGLLGGVPGGSLVSLVPHWSAQGWSVLFEVAGGWMLVLSAGAQIVSTQLATLTLIGFGVVTLLGASSVVVVARRWVHRRAWQRNS
jgi:predicted anti-sigma-YlaC factor YlaD